MVDNIAPDAKSDKCSVKRQEVIVRGFPEALDEQKECLKCGRFATSVPPGKKRKGRTWQVQCLEAFKVSQRNLPNSHLRNSNS